MKTIQSPPTNNPLELELPELRRELLQAGISDWCVTHLRNDLTDHALNVAAYDDIDTLTADTYFSST